MKVGKPRKNTDEPGIGIDASNYAQRACDFIRARGKEGFVIRGVDGEKGSARTRLPATEAQWLAWLGYLDGLGVPTAFMKAHGMATVPSEWPEEFDSACGVSDRIASVFRSRWVTPGDRAQVLALMQKLADGMASWETKKPVAPKPRTMEELAEFGRAPLRVSEAFKRLMKHPGEPVDV